MMKMLVAMSLNYVQSMVFSLSFFSYTAFTMAFWPKSTGLRKKWSGLHLEWCWLKAPQTATTFSNFLLVENWTIDCSVIMKTFVFFKNRNLIEAFSLIMLNRLRVPRCSLPVIKIYICRVEMQRKGWYKHEWAMCSSWLPHRFTVYPGLLYHSLKDYLSCWRCDNINVERNQWLLFCFFVLTFSVFFWAYRVTSWF